MGSAGLLLPAPPSMVSLASVQRLSDELPNITFAFASEVGYKVKSSLVRFSYPSMHLPETAPMAYGTGSRGPCISHRDEYMCDMAVINMSHAADTPSIMQQSHRCIVDAATHDNTLLTAKAGPCTGSCSGLLHS